jgi:hypothetical protein
MGPGTDAYRRKRNTTWRSVSFIELQNKIMPIFQMEFKGEESSIHARIYAK